MDASREGNSGVPENEHEPSTTPAPAVGTAASNQGQVGPTPSAPSTFHPNSAQPQAPLMPGNFHQSMAWNAPPWAMNPSWGPYPNWSIQPQGSPMPMNHTYGPCGQLMQAGPSSATQSQSVSVSGKGIAQSAVPSSSANGARFPWNFVEGDATVQPKAKDKKCVVPFKEVDDECGYCTARSKDLRLLQPCGHFPFCASCIRSHAAGKAKATCGFCKRPVNEVLTVVRCAPGI